MTLSVPFVWSLAAEEAFLALKLRFSSPPVLVQPDPARQFVVEVDTSDTGVGAVLSQRATDDKLVHSFQRSCHLQSATTTWVIVNFRR